MAFVSHNEQGRGKHARQGEWVRGRVRQKVEALGVHVLANAATADGENNVLANTATVLQH